MPSIVKSSGQYTVKETNESVSYDYEYQSFNDLQDAIDTLGEVEALKTIQRMVKVDANNVAREKAKTANGHSARKPMTEAEKAEAKAERQANKALLDKIKALSPEQKRALGL